MEILQPPGWKRPKGYSNGIAAQGKMIFVAGQIGWNEEEKFPTSDLAGQTRQALENVLAVLKEAGAGAEHIVRMTWYITDKKEYLANAREIGQVYRELIGKHYPVMSLVQVADLLEDEAKVEIEVTAVLDS